MTTFIGTFRFAVALLVVSHTTPAPAWAKGETSRLVLSCMGFSHPVEITSPAALTIENGPWGGGFIDSSKGRVTVAPTNRRTCEVDFYVRYSRRDERLAYVVYYYPGQGSGSGFLYLPGKGEPWYALNVSSMFRAGIDGTWRVASRRWEQALGQHSIGAI
jgi:hypothetical protein